NERRRQGRGRRDEGGISRALSPFCRSGREWRMRRRSRAAAARRGRFPAWKTAHPRSLRVLNVGATSKPQTEREPFGRIPDGTEVERIVLRADEFEAGIISFGATLHTLHVRDRDGRSDDIVLGHDTFDEYLAQRKFLGATVGRYANRIAGAQFTLDGA